MANIGKRVWGWMFFDWASQPYFTLLITFIFAPYFTSAVMDDPVRGQEYWGWMMAAVGILVAILGPILGSTADAAGTRLRWVIVFSAMYVAGALALWWAVPGSSQVFLILFAFGFGMIGLELATAFTNAMLPDLGPEEDIGIISGCGWAFGYAGGLLALALVLAFFAENDAGNTLLGSPPIFGLDPETREGTRSVGPFTAIWYLVFMIPFFLWVRETGKPSKGSESIAGLIKTIKQLPKNPSLFSYLASSMFYRDALNGVFAFGGIYAAGVLEWSIVQIGTFGILSLVSGTLFAWLGGYADRRYGPKAVISVCIIVLSAVCLVIVLTSKQSVAGFSVSEGSSLPDIVFYICGCIIGACGGVIQSASRTMMVNQSDPERMTEAFGLYAFAGKATAFLAPALIALMTRLTEDIRLGVSPIIVLFLVGLLFLRFVDFKPSTKKYEQ